jgi:protein SCO1/2
VGDLAIGYEGRRVRALRVEVAGKPRLEHVWPLDGQRFQGFADINRRLVRRAATMGREDVLVEKDYLPDFALIDQHGQAVLGKDLRDQPTVISFIFTRCPDPRMCPATTKRLAALGKNASDRGLEDARFVLISFDPAYDTPGILNQYARSFGMEDESFSLLTGDEAAIKALLRLFGVRTVEADGTIDHTQVTLLSDRFGRIVFRQPGSRWSAEAILAQLQSL